MRLIAAREFSTLWKKVFHTVEKTARIFHTMEKCFAIFPHNGKNVSTLWKTSDFRMTRARRPQDVGAEDFFWILAGLFAKIAGGFSDDAALRAPRAGLVSASGRPRSGSAEKMPVGFRAAKIQKKSSLFSLPTPATP
jgi:hypothetical protein